VRIMRDNYDILTMAFCLTLGVIIGVYMTIHASPLTKEIEDLKQETAQVEEVGE